MILAWLVACTVTPQAKQAPKRTPKPQVVAEKPAHADRFRALPAPRTSSVETTRLRVELGAALFTDTRLSGAGACATCHDPATGGASAGIVVGHSGQSAPQSVPSVFNSALQEAQFWDGRAATVELANNSTNKIAEFL